MLGSRPTAIRKGDSAVRAAGSPQGSPERTLAIGAPPNPSVERAKDDCTTDKERDTRSKRNATYRDDRHYIHPGNQGPPEVVNPAPPILPNDVIEWLVERRSAIWKRVQLLKDSACAVDRAVVQYHDADATRGNTEAVLSLHRSFDPRGLKRRLQRDRLGEIIRSEDLSHDDRRGCLTDRA